VSSLPTTFQNQAGGPPVDGEPMSLIVALIKPFKIQEVKDTLQASGIDGMSITEVTGAGMQRGQGEIYRGSESVMNLLPKVKIEVAVPARFVPTAVDCIVKSAWTGKIGDGKVFVLPLDGVARIRADERGNATT
jgi:nitrogen regulatory protein PII